MNKKDWAFLSMFCLIFGIVMMCVTLPYLFQQQMNIVAEALMSIGHKMGGAGVVLFTLALISLLIGIMAWFASTYQIVRRKK